MNLATTALLVGGVITLSGTKYTERNLYKAGLVCLTLVFWNLGMVIDVSG